MSRFLSSSALLVTLLACRDAVAEDPAFPESEALAAVSQAKSQLELPGAPAAPAAEVRLGLLDWGGWTASALARKAAAQSDPVGQASARVLQVAQQRLGETVTPVSALHLQGVVFSDPQFQASQAAMKPMSDIYNWAMCARIAQGPLADQCRRKAVAAAQAWAAAFRPTGDPINENQFVPLFLAIDLLSPVLAPEEKQGLLAWVGTFAGAGDALYGTWKPTDGRLTNNWASWRLLIRGLAAEITADAGLRASTRDMIARLVSVNILADGSSLDFHQRDALHYHVYDLAALVDLSLYCPDLVDPASRASIAKGLEFLRPYFTGETRHVEFALSKVKFDAVRRAAGDPEFQPAPWNPANARQLLLLGRAAYPELASWTAGVVDPNYSPMMKQLAALHQPR